jgi:gamma-glutamyl-gamma-aminobutyrate hydrolase PuuD
MIKVQEMKILNLILCVLLSLPVVVAQENAFDLRELYRTVDSCRIDNPMETPVLIGLSSNRTSKGSFFVPGAYVQAVMKAGGTPVIIPVITDIAVLRNIVRNLDGLVMIGGEDIHPKYYREELLPGVNDIDSLQDIYDLMLIRLATNRQMPLLGICRGEQVMNVAFGGTLYQDIPTQYAQQTVNHKQSLPEQQGSHTVRIEQGSQLAAILGKQEVVTNTFHHQGVKEVAPGFRAVAHATDDFIEAIEASSGRPVLGVQFHPESLIAGGDTVMLKIFEHIVGKAVEFRQSK